MTEGFTLTENLLFCDLETYSPTPIRCGTHRYAEEAEVLLFTWAIGEQPVQVWDCTTKTPMPEKLHSALEDTKTLTVWHNGGMFDTVVLRHAMGIKIPMQRIHDTLAQARAHGLPGSLSTLCEILKIPVGQTKQKTGRQLIQLFCKPSPKSSKIRRATRQTHKVEWQHFIAYACSDIEALREVYKRLPKWNYQGAELALWYLDQQINDRGFKVDVDLVQGATRAVDRAQKVLAGRTQDITEGEIRAATQRDALLKHILEAYGVSLPDMQKSTLERRIADPELPPAVKELLSIRLQASATSTSKYRTLLNSVSRDGRMRGTLQFCGASRTGRWAGRIFQPQNLSRETLTREEIDFGIECMKANCEELFYE